MDSFSLKIMKLYNERETLTVSQLGAILNINSHNLFEYITQLRRKNFLRIEPNHALLRQLTNESPINAHTPLQITIDGKEAIENAYLLDKQRRNDLIRYIITTGIAIAAFIKSFFF